MKIFQGRSRSKARRMVCNQCRIPSLIVRPDGEINNWLKLETNIAMPYGPGKPLPENFKMEFDVLTRKNFAENTGGLFF